MLASAHELYTPKLKHHQLDIDNLSVEIPSFLKEFISILKNNKVDEAVQLDKIISEFYYSQNFYLYDEENLHTKIETLEEELIAVKKQLEAEENDGAI